MKNPFAGFFRKVFGRFHTPSVPPKPLLSPEQFRDLLIQALEDPAMARLVARLLLPAFPMRGGADPTNVTTTAGGTEGYLPVFTASDNIENSVAFQTSGKVGIGTTTPQTPLAIATTGDTVGLSLGESGSTTGKQLNLGYFTGSDYGYIQALHQGTGYKNLAINPSGGNVGIGTTSPGATLDLGPATGDNVQRIHSGGAITWNNGTSNKNQIYEGNDANRYLYLGRAGVAVDMTLANGNVGIGTNDRLSKLTVKGGASFTATGTVTISASSNAVTGSGTLFTQQVAPGDRVTVETETRRVKTVTDDTHLTVNDEDPFQFGHTNKPMTLLPSILRADDSTTTAPQNVKGLITDEGSLWLGNRLGFLQAGRTVAATELYRDSADFTVLRNFTQLYTNMSLRAPTNPSGTAEREATLSLIRVDSQDNDMEYLDVYNNGYTSETQHGARIQRVKDSGVFRDFVFSQRQQNPATHDFTDYPEVAVVRATRKVGVGTRTTPAKLSVKGESFAATGTLFSGSGTTVTGTGSLFTQEIDPGDKVTIFGQTRTVVSVGPAETSLTVDSAFSGSPSDTTMTVLNQLLRVDDASGNVKVFVTDQGNVGIGTGTPGATLDVVGGVVSRRLTPNRGTALVAGDLALSAGWGASASLAVGANSDDQRGTITITSAGSGQAANPTITLTFKDGAWPNAPFALSKMGGGTGVITNVTETTTTTTLVITFLGTPVAGKTYVIGWLILG